MKRVGAALACMAGFGVGLLPDAAAGQRVIDLPTEDRALEVDPAEVFRVGSLDGEAWETFGDVAGVAFDADGNLYVFDRQASRISVVSPHGAFLRELGQEGEGPGEFRMALNFTVMRDGRIVVADLGHRAYQLFGVDGAFERMVSMGGGDEIRVGEMAPVPGSDAVISGGGGSVIGMGSGPAAEPLTTRPIERVSLTGDVAEVWALAVGWLPPRGEEPTRLEGGGMRLSMAVAGPRTFEPELLVGALPDGGIAFADSTGYAIKVAGPDGTVTRVLRRPFEPRPVTAAMQEAERERRLEELESGRGPRMRIMTDGPGGTRTVGQDAINEMMRGQIAQMQFFPELPVLLDLRTSWTGRIWAQRRGDAPTEPGPIDVLTAEGSYLGTLDAAAVDMPDAFGPDGLAAWIDEDDFGVPIVVVRRLAAEIN